MRLARFASLVSFAALASGPLSAKGVTEADLRGHVEILASDAFEGRKPGTAGETKTIKYIAEAWAKAGLKPAAADGSWFDPVPLIQRGQGSATYAFTAKGRTLRIVSDDIVLIGQKAAYTRSNLPLIFTGAGVTAKGQVAADVKGKAAVVLFGADNVPDNMKSPRARREASAPAARARSRVPSVDPESITTSSSTSTLRRKAAKTPTIVAASFSVGTTHDTTAPCARLSRRSWRKSNSRW